MRRKVYSESMKLPRAASLVLVCVLVVAGVAFVAPYIERNPRITPTRSIRVQGTFVRVAVADTESLREKGLSGVASLSANEGMLFVFEKDGLYSFWMKDMNFPLDIVWLAADGKVVAVAEDRSPASYPESFTPTSPARYALELPAGWVKAHDIGIGDAVEF